MKRQYWCKTDDIFWSLNKFLEVFMCKIYDAIFKTVNWLVSIFHYRNQLEDLIYWHMSFQALKASACMHTAKSLNVFKCFKYVYRNNSEINLDLQKPYLSYLKDQSSFGVPHVALKWECIIFRLEIFLVIIILDMMKWMNLIKSTTETKLIDYYLRKRLVSEQKSESNHKCLIFWFEQWQEY